MPSSSIMLQIIQKIISTKIATFIRAKLKALINSIRMPSVLSFSILKNGAINPTREQALAEASNPSENWGRLSLDKKTSFGLPRWILLIFAVFAVVARFFSETLISSIQLFTQLIFFSNALPEGTTLPFKYAMDGLQYLVNFAAQFGVIIPLGIILYYITQSFREPDNKTLKNNSSKKIK